MGSYEVPKILVRLKTSNLYLATLDSNYTKIPSLIELTLYFPGLDTVAYNLSVCPAMISVVISNMILLLVTEQVDLLASNAVMLAHLLTVSVVVSHVWAILVQLEPNLKSSSIIEIVYVPAG